MKTFAKWLSILLSVCLLLSLTVISASAVATPLPNDNYDRPTVSANKITVRPMVDGKLDDKAWKQATKIDFTQDSLAAGDGLLWSYPDGDDFTELPPDGNGNAYFGWDAEYIYFALQIEDEEHVNNRVQGWDLWREDCLQVQVCHGTSGMFDNSARYELGFAYNESQNRQLGMRWTDYDVGDFLRANKVTDMSKGAGADYYYFVGRDDAKYTTTYEIALKHSWLGGDGLESGEKFMFSFSLHLHEEKLPPACLSNPEAYDGYFMEWAQGLVTGKTMSDAGIITCVGASSDDDKDPTTTTTTTTTRITTTTTTTTTTGNNRPGTTTTTTTTTGNNQQGNTTVPPSNTR
ncbi:MAG: hypothetical protein E7549_09525, partial [Ruminococcaceae bacterium]|nr:hypothetical protein [Oscillospiraceae bacterium]